MFSLILTILFYLSAGLLVAIWCEKSVRLFAWGSLPIVWVSVLSLLGLLETLCFLPSGFSLALLVVGLFVWVFSKQRQAISNFVFEKQQLQAWPLGLFLVAVFAVIYEVHAVVPWGSWDPMFTWIMRARFLVDGGPQWANGFSNDLALLHPDYPPMFSWALVPLWGLDGSQSSLAVASLIYPFLIAWLLVLIGWKQACCSNCSHSILGTIVVALVLSTPLFFYLFAIKSLDFILSFTIFTSLAWYQLSRIQKSKFTESASYFIVVWAALVKNEGQLWIVSFFGGLLLLQIIRNFSNSNVEETQQQSLVRWKYVLQATFVPLVFLVLFKITIAPPSDLVHPQRAFEISQVVQPDVFLHPYSLLVRLDQIESLEWHKVIWNQFGNVFLNWKSFGLLLWSIPTFLILKMYFSRKTFPVIGIAILIQLLGYYTVYLLTPYNPYWHVTTSMDRLLIHVAPSAVAVIGFSLCHLAEQKTSSEVASNNRKWLQATILCIPILSVGFSYSQFQAKTFPWGFQNESIAQQSPIDEIEFPDTSQATFITEKFEPATLYRTQFEMVPVILVVDRREQIMLGSFSNDEKLKQYCKENAWELKKHKDGLGWAISKDPNGGLPHMDELREQLELQSN